MWSSPSSNGYGGSITTAFSNRLAIFLQPSTRRPSTVAERHKSSTRYSTKPVSGDAGAVHFQIGVVPGRIDILTSISGVEFEEAWSARKEIEIEGIRVPVSSR